MGFTSLRPSLNGIIRSNGFHESPFSHNLTKTQFPISYAHLNKYYQNRLTYLLNNNIIIHRNMNSY